MNIFNHSTEDMGANKANEYPPFDYPNTIIPSVTSIQHSRCEHSPREFARWVSCYPRSSCPLVYVPRGTSAVSSVFLLTLLQGRPVRHAMHNAFTESKPAREIFNPSIHAHIYCQNSKPRETKHEAFLNLGPSMIKGLTVSIVQDI